MSERKRRVTVEVVARMDIPQDTPMNRVLLHKSLTLPLHVAPIGPGPNDKGWVVPADFLTYQWRATEGDYGLPPLPYYPNLAPVVDTRNRVVSEVLLDYRVGRGIPGDLSDHEGLVRRIVAALDEYDRRKADAPDRSS